MPTTRNNGWKLGTDPILRPLRVGATIMAIGVFAALVLDHDRATDLGPMAFAFALLVLLLGYEGLARRVPGIGGEDKDE